MDARTERRLKRAKRREEILKKTEDDKKRKRPSPIDCLRVVRKKVDAPLIRQHKERMHKLAFTAEERWHLNEAGKRECTINQWRKDRWPRIMEKIRGNVAFSQDLMRINENLTGCCEAYKKVVSGYQSQSLTQLRAIDKHQKEIADLKRRLKKINDELCEWKKWHNSLGVHDNMMNEN